MKLKTKSKNAENAFMSPLLTTFRGDLTSAFF